MTQRVRKAVGTLCSSSSSRRAEEDVDECSRLRPPGGRGGLLLPRLQNHQVCFDFHENRSLAVLLCLQPSSLLCYDSIPGSLVLLSKAGRTLDDIINPVLGPICPPR